MDGKTIDLFNNRAELLGTFYGASIDTSENYFTIKGPDGDALGTYDRTRYGFGVRMGEQSPEPLENIDEQNEG